MKLTLENLHALFNEGAPNSAQLHLLGVKKARRGWLKQMVGREITDELYQRILSIKGRKPKGATRKEWREAKIVMHGTDSSTREPQPQPTPPMTHTDIISRLDSAHTLLLDRHAVGALNVIEALLQDLRQDLSNGITTARGRSLTQDYTLWHRPPHGTPFLLDWGTKEGMEAKVAEMVIEPPTKETQP